MRIIIPISGAEVKNTHDEDSGGLSTWPMTQRPGLDILENAQIKEPRKLNNKSASHINF